MPEKTIDLHTRVSQTPGCIAADLGGEIAILEPISATYFSLSKVGAFIWNTLQSSRPVSEIVEAVLGEFEVERERCSQDVLALLQALREQQLLQIDS